MRWLALLLFFGPFITFSHAQNAEDTVNGDLIAEPTLFDYNAGSRTPGFSEISDITE